jgi:hypothetical protein
MANYRRLHPLGPPPPFATREEFREAVRRAVFGEDQAEKPICHRPVKRKLIGALHEETLFGPVIDTAGVLTENFTAKKSILAIEPNHLRMPRAETPDEAIERLAARRQRHGVDERQARKWARSVVASPGYAPAIVDPPPGKSGLVRDVGLRHRIRSCLREYQYRKRNKSGEAVGEPYFLDPDNFTDNEMKQAVESGVLRHESGVPIHSVVLLRTMSDPVLLDRKRPDYTTGRMTCDEAASSKRAYVGGNNHHIEIRVSKDKKGKETWSGQIVTAYVAAQRKLGRLRALRQAGIPKPRDFRKLLKTERAKFASSIGAIERAHPLVDRSDNDAKGGLFVMSLCEGEMLWMKHKETEEVGYFVIAKLDRPHSIVLVPHWDARSATERKDAEGKKIPDSRREQFAVTPQQLKELAPPNRPHAIKVGVSPLGVVTELERD